MGSAIFCSSLRPGLERFCAEFEEEGVKTFACMNGITLGLMRVTENAEITIYFLWEDVDGIDIVDNTAKPSALPLN